MAPKPTWTAAAHALAATMAKGARPATIAKDVTPGFPWNATLDPGETDSSMGFCANRTVSGSGVLPTIVSTTATF